jgi:hypothetical protein
MDKLSWVRDGTDWLKTTCSHYYIYTSRFRSLDLYIVDNGGLRHHSEHSTVGEAMEAAEGVEEEVYAW